MAKRPSRDEVERRNELTAKLREFVTTTRQAGEHPTQAAFEKWGKHNNAEPVSAYQNFFGSWQRAFRESGVDIYRGRPTETRPVLVLEALNKASEKVDGVLTIQKYRDWASSNNAPSVREVKRVFGAFSSACLVAGLDTRQDRYQPGEPLERFLRATCRGLEGRLSTRAYEARRQPGWPTASTISKAYGGWDRALEAAGLGGKK